MNEVTIIQVLNETLYMTLIISAPIMGIGMFVGITTSIIQTVTSIQDQSLAFVPKLLATVVTIFLMGSWILNKIVEFTVRILTNLPQFAH
ncbi:MAG: flagellar biosynthetic protein FliQ [Candidatus Riflebacteria bacterium]|nr:flagellar biosynthetic protein FliQ [Candidatus Riflebacteria bacterium]